MDLEIFRGVVPFVAVAEEKSFRRAAARLGVSPAAVSKSVRTLEKDLGIALLARGPQATLTREGERFFEGCRPAVLAMMGARAGVENNRHDPSGEMVLTVPFAVAGLVPPALTALRNLHPALWFRVVVTDRVLRIGEERVDVAVRIGPLAGTSLIARRIHRTRVMTVASPAYLARAGVPRQVAELETHDLIVLIGSAGKPYPWLFRSGPREVRPRVALDHAPSLVDAALADLGIAQVFPFMVETHVRAARLVPLFPDEVVDGPLVHAVCAPGRRASARVRAAFDAFTSTFDFA